MFIFIAGILVGYVMGSYHHLIVNNVNVVTKTLIDLKYIYKNNTYITRINVKRGPSKIYTVLNQHDHPVTELLKMYLGPNEDFHGRIMRPSDFNCKQLTFYMTDKRQLTFNDYENIIIK